jgi:hypothetical protein
MAPKPVELLYVPGEHVEHTDAPANSHSTLNYLPIIVKMKSLIP